MEQFNKRVVLGSYWQPMFPLIHSAFAEGGLPDAIDPRGLCDFINGEISWGCIPAYINQLTFIVVSFTVSVSLLMLMVNGFRYMLGGVSDEAGGGIDSAKKGIRNALIGLLISFLIYVIIDTIVRSVT